MGCLLNYSPKFSVKVYLFVYLNIVIGDVHQFIGHCLIPLNSWYIFSPIQPNLKKYYRGDFSSKQLNKYECIIALFCHIFSKISYKSVGYLSLYF